MPLLLAPGLSFCEADGRRIFLDVGRDRYFCLRPAADAAFATLVNGQKPTADQSARLATLGEAGILVDAASGDPPRACQAVPIVTAPVEDDRLPRPGIARVLAAAWAIQRAKRAIRVAGLAAMVDDLQRRKRAVSGERDAPPGELTELASIFAATSRIVATFDQCLPLSCALLGHCLAAGVAADLVLGVKLRPFQAHAWVQADGALVSDRLATVRQFTPILVL